MPDHPALVSRIASEGHRVVMGGDDSYIHDKERGRNIKLYKKDDVLVMWTKTVPPGEGGQSQDERKENDRMLGELSFARQAED